MAVQAIRHQGTDVGKSEFAQAADHERRARRAVHVEVAYDRDPAIAIGEQQRYGVAYVAEQADRRET